MSIFGVMSTFHNQVIRLLIPKEDTLAFKDGGDFLRENAGN